MSRTGCSYIRGSALMLYAVVRYPDLVRWESLVTIFLVLMSSSLLHHVDIVPGPRFNAVFSFWQGNALLTRGPDSKIE